MTQSLTSTHDLTGTRVVGGTSGTRRIGRVKSFVFHPSEKRCISLVVKRPDLLWMFRRKDKFIMLDSFKVEDGVIKIESDALKKGPAIAEELKVSWDSCVIWLGLPLVMENGETIGHIGNVIFDKKTGEVASIEADLGATANTLLGTRKIPASLIKGFRSGIGASTRDPKDGGVSATAREDLGAILVSNAVREIETDGGLAERAGETTAVVAEKAEQAAAVAKEKAQEAKEAVSEKTGITGKKTEEAAVRGAYAVGEQVSKTQGMFSAFKEEYDKARHEEE